MPIDILYGGDGLRATIDRGGDPAALIASWTRDEDAFRKTRDVPAVLSRCPLFAAYWFFAASRATRIWRACLWAWAA